MMHLIQDERGTALLEALRAVESAPIHYALVVFHKEALRTHYPLEHVVRCVLGAVQKSLPSLEGEVFLLKSNDVVWFVRDLHDKHYEALLRLVSRTLRSHPQLTPEPGKPPYTLSDPEHFVSLYHLSAYWQCLYHAVQRCCRNGEALPKRAFLSSDISEGMALAYQSLHVMQHYISNLPMEQHITRRRVVHCTHPTKDMTLVYEMLGVDQDTVTVALGSHESMQHSNQVVWYLVQRYIEQQWVMWMQTCPETYWDYGTMLSLSLETLQSDLWYSFACRLPKRVRSLMIVSIGIGDVFHDITTYLQVREQLRSLGFRVGIVGVELMALSLLHVKKLGADVLHLAWSDHVLSAMSQHELKHLAEAIEESANVKIVLTGCHSAYHISFGKKIGLSLFQGDYVNQLPVIQAA